MQYIYLAVAIVAEVIATTALKSSASFTRLVPSTLVVVGYGAAFFLLSLCLKTMKVGVVYAIWSGLGIVLVTIASLIVHRQKVDAAGVAGMALIVAGAVVLNLYSDTAAH